MTERSSDPQDERSPAGQPEAGNRPGLLVQAVALVGVVVLTVIITLWVTRDGDQNDVGIFIPPPAPVTFQIAGEVMRPGVYSLEGNPRVDDAIDAAGGLTASADERQINLALRVRDGAKVVIPARGSTSVDAGASTIGADSGSGGGTVPGTGTTTGLVDLNTASKDQLVALPGIGNVRAESIIQWRTNNLISGVDDLLAISGIGPATVDSIRNFVSQP